MSEHIRVVLGQGLNLEEASFVERPNQFTLVLEDERGGRFKAAMADRGRLEALLTPGRPILIEPRSGAKRKTSWQAIAALVDEDRLVSLDTHLPNRLVAEVLSAGKLDEMIGATVRSWRAERTIGDSRFDFVLDLEDETRLILEVKSIGRIDPDKVARFPDAPTTRGARHVRELSELLEPGHTRCAVLFIVQGDHATAAAIDARIDPAFAKAVAVAREAGVEFFVRACPLTREGITWGEAITWS